MNDDIEDDNEITKMKIKRGFVGRVIGSGKHARINYLGITLILMTLILGYLLICPVKGIDNNQTIYTILPIITGFGGYLSGQF